MLSLEKMQKIRVIAPRDRLKQVTDCLYKYGAIQVTECKLAQTDLPLDDFQKISEMLIKLRSEEKLLDLKFAIDPAPIDLPEMLRKYAALELHRLDEKRAELQKLEAQANSLEADLNALLPFRNIRIKLGQIKSDRLTNAYFELKPKMELKLEKALLKIPHEIAYIYDGNKKYALLAYDTRQEEKVALAISKYSTQTLDIPFHVEGPIKDEIRSIEGKLIDLQNQIGLAKSWIEEYRQKYGKAIIRLKEQLKIASIKAELPFKFGRTENFSVVEGWISQKFRPEFDLEMDSAGKILVEEIVTKEVPPSKLSNPKLIKPFEFMVEFFSLPKSYELDPTLFISLTYPLFFGMIMGDIGYGMMAFTLALLLKLKMKGEIFQRIGGMLALSSASAILFGIIYGEFFGLEHIFGTELHPLIHRVSGVEEMINLSILIGVLHLALGFLIGVYINYMHGHKKHAYAKIGWLMVEISLIATIINLADVALISIFSPLKEIISLQMGLAGLVIGSAAIAVFEKPTNLFELPSLLSNILSYLRIAALGLSGVIISMIINQLPVDFDGFWAIITLARPFDIGAVLAFLAFAIMLLFGHVVALALAILEAGVQSLRLHYVEFFSKFYEGGGLPFIPLRKKK